MCVEGDITPSSSPVIDDITLNVEPGAISCIVGLFKSGDDEFSISFLL